MTFASYITLTRVFLIPPIIYLTSFGKITFNLLALLIFLIASLTDYFDGYLARKYNAVSQLGEILDPIADKILILFLLFALAVNLSSNFIGFIGALIIAREIWVGALRDINARNGRSDATKVTFLAKIKTTIQLITISIYLLGLSVNQMLLIVIGDIFLLISLFITLYTGFLYTLKSLNPDES